MKNFKSIIASILSVLLIAQTVPAETFSSQAVPFSISIPSRLGFITDAYPQNASPAQKPDVILIQNLHVNRSVQFAISGILKKLQDQNLLPGTIAVEGATGLMNTASMQAYPDSKVRKLTADYLVRQGEMPGAMHFVVTEGKGQLYGVETNEVYQANLQAFRQSYNDRERLSQELEKLAQVLPHLKRNPELKAKAEILEKDVAAVQALVSLQITPSELPEKIHQSLASIERLKQILSPDVADSIMSTLSSAANFYAFAGMRNEDLFKNTLQLRTQEKQTVTVLITGGYHTQSLAEQFKQMGLSYVVITPTIAHHDRVDDELYVERMLGRHLTPEQVATGIDWTAQMAEPTYIADDLFDPAATTIAEGRTVNGKVKRVIATSLVVLGMVLPAFISQAQTTRPQSRQVKEAPQQILTEMYEDLRHAREEFQDAGLYENKDQAPELYRLANLHLLSAVKSIYDYEWTPDGRVALSQIASDNHESSSDRDDARKVLAKESSARVANSKQASQAGEIFVNLNFAAESKGLLSTSDSVATDFAGNVRTERQRGDSTRVYYGDDEILSVDPLNLNGHFYIYLEDKDTLVVTTPEGTFRISEVFDPGTMVYKVFVTTLQTRIRAASAPAPKPQPVTSPVIEKKPTETPRQELARLRLSQQEAYDAVYGPDGVESQNAGPNANQIQGAVYSGLDNADKELRDFLNSPRGRSVLREISRDPKASVDDKKFANDELKRQEKAAPKGTPISEVMQRDYPTTPLVERVQAMSANRSFFSWRGIRNGVILSGMLSIATLAEAATTTQTTALSPVVNPLALMVFMGAVAVVVLLGLFAQTLRTTPMGIKVGEVLGRIALGVMSLDLAIYSYNLAPSNYKSPGALFALALGVGSLFVFYDAFRIALGKTVATTPIIAPEPIIEADPELIYPSDENLIELLSEHWKLGYAGETKLRAALDHPGQTIYLELHEYYDHRIIPLDVNSSDPLVVLRAAISAAKQFKDTEFYSKFDVPELEAQLAAWENYLAENHPILQPPSLENLIELLNREWGPLGGQEIMDLQNAFANPSPEQFVTFAFAGPTDVYYHVSLPVTSNDPVKVLGEFMHDIDLYRGRDDARYEYNNLHPEMLRRQLDAWEAYDSLKQADVRTSTSESIKARPSKTPKSALIITLMAILGALGAHAQTFKWNPSDVAHGGGTHYYSSRNVINDGPRWRTVWFDIGKLDKTVYSEVSVTFESVGKGQVNVQLLPDDARDSDPSMPGEYNKIVEAHRGENTVVLDIAGFSDGGRWSNVARRLVIKEESYDDNAPMLDIKGDDIKFFKKGSNAPALSVGDQTTSSNELSEGKPSFDVLAAEIDATTKDSDLWSFTPSGVQHTIVDSGKVTWDWNVTNAEQSWIGWGFNQWAKGAKSDAAIDTTTQGREKVYLRIALQADSGSVFDIVIEDSHLNGPSGNEVGMQSDDARIIKKDDAWYISFQDVQAANPKIDLTNLKQVKFRAKSDVGRLVISSIQVVHLNDSSAAHPWRILAEAFLVALFTPLSIGGAIKRMWVKLFGRHVQPVTEETPTAPRPSSVLGTGIYYTSEDNVLILLQRLWRFDETMFKSLEAKMKKPDTSPLHFSFVDSEDKVHDVAVVINSKNPIEVVQSFISSAKPFEGSEIYNQLHVPNLEAQVAEWQWEATHAVAGSDEDQPAKPQRGSNQFKGWLMRLVRKILRISPAIIGLGILGAMTSVSAHAATIYDTAGNVQMSRGTLSLFLLAEVGVVIGLIAAYLGHRRWVRASQRDLENRLKRIQFPEEMPLSQRLRMLLSPSSDNLTLPVDVQKRLKEERNKIGVLSMLASA